MKLVRAIHAGMHRVIHRQRGLLSGRECRRTDDSLGRSAALHKTHLRSVQNPERLGADVAQAKRGAYGDVVLDITFINGGLINHQTRRADYLGRHLTELGVPVTDGPTRSRSGRFCFIDAPEGYEVELIEQA